MFNTQWVVFRTATKFPTCFFMARQVDKGHLPLWFSSSCVYAHRCRDRKDVCRSSYCSCRDLFLRLVAVGYARMYAIQKLYGSESRHMVLELNASDDRGIVVVRETIKQFAETRPSRPYLYGIRAFPPHESTFILRIRRTLGAFQIKQGNLLPKLFIIVR